MAEAELCEWDQDEVAFILGHEIGHVVKRHAKQRLAASTFASLATKASPARGLVDAALRKLLQTYVLNSYSKRREFEADGFGVGLAKSAGFDPQGAIRFFERLLDDSKTDDSFDFFSGHPKMEARIEEGVAVSLNGEIYRDIRDLAIPEGAEIFLLPRIQGG